MRQRPDAQEPMSRGAASAIAARAHPLWVFSLAILLLDAGCGGDRPAAPKAGLPPAAVTDLRWLRADSTRVVLAWTAPEEERGHQRARIYDVRMAHADTTAWERMLSLFSPPVPGEPGRPESLVVAPLLPDTTYVFQLRSAGADTLWSEPSNRAAGRTTLSPDGTAPAPVTLGLIRSTEHSVTLAWIAPGDDGDRGTAAEYAFSIVDLDVGGPWTEPGPRPEPAGTRQEFEILGLEAGHLFDFSLMAADEVGNWSISPEPIRAASSIPEDIPWSRGFAPPPHGQGLPEPVSALVAHDDLLYAGVSKPESETSGHLVYAWNGEAWTVVGPGQLTGQVNALLVCQGELVAAGHIWFVDGTPSRNLARWDGERWRGFGSGPDGEVYDAVAFNGDLFITGTFWTVDTTAVQGGARWDGERWRDHPSSSGWGVWKPAFGSYRDSLYLASGAEIHRVEPLPPRRLIRLPWVAGCIIEGRNGIQRLRSWDDRLFAAGRNSSNNVLAEVSGGGLWSPLGPEVDAMDCNGGAFALLATSRGLVVGGSFHPTESGNWSNLFLWDGQQAHPFGTGVRDEPRVVPGSSGDVRALAEFRGHIYVGGSFKYAGATPSLNVARWEDWK